MIHWDEYLHRQLETENDTDSHTEIDAYTFHPSYLARCKRTAVKQKFGLEDHSRNTLWNFRLGTMIHREFERLPLPPGVEQEIPCQWEGDDITITGTADVYDPHEGVVYDFKTRKSFGSYFDPPDESHMTQLACYAEMLGADRGQVVYVLKSAPWDADDPVIRTYPEDSLHEFDGELFDRAVSKARSIRGSLVELPTYPSHVDDVPFDRCGCFICEGEEVYES